MAEMLLVEKKQNKQQLPCVGKSTREKGHVAGPQFLKNFSRLHGTTLTTNLHMTQNEEKRSRNKVQKSTPGSLEM